MNILILIIIILPILASFYNSHRLINDKQYRDSCDVETWIGLAGIFLLGCIPFVSFGLMILVVGYLVSEAIHEGRAPRWLYLTKDK